VGQERELRDKIGEAQKGARDKHRTCRKPSEIQAKGKTDAEPAQSNQGLADSRPEQSRVAARRDDPA
jgi:hypothetical protein